MSLLQKIHSRSPVLICLFLSSCFSQNTAYEQDSVAHYATRHSTEEGWQLESIELFDIGDYRGPAFEIGYYEEPDLGVSKFRNLLVHHILSFIQDNENNQKLIKAIRAKDNILTYRNLSIELLFYEKKGDKSKGPIAFVTYQDENVRYWILNQSNHKYELVHMESIHDSLESSSLCKDKNQIKESLRSPGQFL